MHNSADFSSLKLDTLADKAPLIPKSFIPLKAPKRGLGRESLSDSVNSIRRVAVDRIAATDYSLAYAWRYGCYLFNNCCYICGLYFLDEKDGLQADHVIPPIEGGSGNAGNILPAHRSCNHRKGDTHPDEYFKDRPELILKIHHFQSVFEYAGDKTLFVTASEIASDIANSITKQILQARNRRELSLEDNAVDSLEIIASLTAPIVQTLMSAVSYFLANENFAPSAQSKMYSYSQRILQKWYGVHAEDLFTQNEEVLRQFILDFCLELTAHRDSFSRTHRAFRTLAEVFDSKTLAMIYQESSPVTLIELSSAYDYIDSVWVRKIDETKTSFKKDYKRKKPI